jgi:hypothetical protein
MLIGDLNQLQSRMPNIGNDELAYKFEIWTVVGIIMLTKQCIYKKFISNTKPNVFQLQNGIKLYYSAIKCIAITEQNRTEPLFTLRPRTLAYEVQIVIRQSNMVIADRDLLGSFTFHRVNDNGTEYT